MRDILSNNIVMEDEDQEERHEHLALILARDGRRVGMVLIVMIVAVGG